MRTTVRATRSYMAGLGTSGSLVAGAALLFVLGSAIVAFRGWPQVATGPATTSVAAAAQPTAPSHTARRLAAVLRRRGVIATVAAVRTGGVRSGATSSGRGGPRTGSGSLGSRPGGPVTASGKGTSASAGSASASGGCGSSSCSNPQSLVTHLSKTVAQQVTDIGSSVGSRLGATSGSVGGSLAPVSPPLANSVQSGGKSAGTAVSGTATTAGNAVNQVGTALGGGH